MITEDKVENIVNEKINESSLYLIDVKVQPNQAIFVTVDSTEGLTIQEIKMLSRHIETELDREVEDFSLEVSSPGIDKPFKVYQQYVKAVGRNIEILTNEEEIIEGKLIEVDEEGIKVEQKQKKTTNVVELKFEQISKTKYQISFK